MGLLSKSTFLMFYYSVHYLRLILLSFPSLSLFSHAQLLVTLWTIAHQAPLSMGFSRQEYWSELAMSSSRGSS